MKVLNLVLCALFLLFGAVQYNDPDPWAWMLLYCFVAVMFGMAAFGHYYRPALIAGLAVCIIWMVTLIPDFIEWINVGMPNIAEHMKAETPYIELTREFLGLVICILGLGFMLRRERRFRV